MSRRRRLSGLVATAIGAGMALLLSGCAYDYLQHTDRVGYSAGDAVKANLAQETINPSKHSMYLKGGLGKNGQVADKPTTADTP